ncbi:sine oculis-binding protein homolog isoform X2 [Corythoichthys intestinalis]|uniref:sine oculis-binding protein homolog isoform X2 n=1 Tax=Corythoichthys intestinalis TaxID=161448 RepID=UPI0025A4FFE3|nr:sine oculis-binding protein homolog isoform X2 [Corythoichthys intestinalis]XP_061807004.1 sine oculis-binding protein homolog [Nerophis lumbriciformis]
MPEMEKGRPPESKRSRKPAHPVKREINQEMKTFAESTMNELLGWYGYDKVDLRDAEANEIRNYRERRQHVSVLKENSLPKPKTLDSKVSHTVLAMKSVERESFTVPSSSSSSTSTSSSTAKEHKSAPVIVPLIKPSAVDDVQNVQIVCVWCQKEGVKRYSLCMGSELKSFCSEKCFAACRRAYFKRNKARDEDLHGERSPQHPHTEDTPRLVMKINSNVRVCDWCKHVRHTKEYLDFGSGEERLQFCSTKCLNQYKMDVFYREARAALTCSSPARAGQEGRSDHNLVGQKLLTPESWNNGSSTGEALQRDKSPKGPTPIPGSSESSSISPSESSSSKLPVSGQRSLDRPIQPPPPPPAVEVSPHSALIPPPLPRHPLEHSPIPQLRMPFIRPPLHAQGLRSPLANNHHPRPPGPSSSPIHRPAPSPHLQPPTSSSINPPGLMHPLPRHYYPGLHSPPLMLPRGPVPMPPIMNFGIPSFSPLLPQPTVLVPYPIIVPLPVPIPIPIPIPVPPKRNLETPNHTGVIQPVPEGIDRCRSIPARFPSPGIPEGNSQLLHHRISGNVPHSLPSPSDPNSKDIGWVKSERPFSSPSLMCHSGSLSPRAQYNTSPSSARSSEGQMDYKQQQHSERQVIQRVLQRTQVKVEPNVKTAVDLLGIEESGSMQGTRSGLSRSSPPPPSSQPSSHDTIYQHQDCHTSPSRIPTIPTVNNNQYDSLTSAPKSQNHGPNGISSVLSIACSGSALPQKVPISPADPALTELESIKENKCSVVCPVRVEGQVNQTEEPSAVVRDAGDDPHLPDEDHAYALPTAPKIGGTTTPLLLPKLRDKGSLRSPANTPSAGDMEPALKRRCLRIRDQNK